MISDRGLLGHLINTLSRIKVMQSDKAIAIRYIDRYLEQRNSDKRLITLLGRVRKVLEYESIGSGIKQSLVIALQRERKSV